MSEQPSSSSSPSAPASAAFSDFWLLTIPLLVTLLIGAGLLALNLRISSLPDDSSGTVLVIFPPRFQPEHIFDSVLRADGRLINSTWFDSVWVVYSEQAGFVERLKAQGAWAALNPALLQSVSISGCFLVTPDALERQESR
jgi:hypothetical protein